MEKGKIMGKRRVNYADNNCSLFAIISNRANNAPNLYLQLSSIFQKYKIRFQLCFLLIMRHFKPLRCSFNVVGYEAIVFVCPEYFPSIALILIAVGLL